jgi:hypothetical protein
MFVVLQRLYILTTGIRAGGMENLFRVTEKLVVLHC